METVADQWMRAVTRGLIRLTLLVLLTLGLWQGYERLHAVITSLVVATVLAYIMRPMANWLMNARLFVSLHPFKLRHTRRTVATLYVLIFMMLAGYFGLRLIISPFIREAHNLAVNYPRLQGKAENIAGSARDWYMRSVPPRTRDWIQQQVGTSGGAAPDFKAKFTEWVQGVVKSLVLSAQNIVELVLLPVLAFYFALDSKKLKHEFVALLPRHRREVLRIIHLFNQIMNRYVVGQALLCGIAGIVVGLFLWLTGMNYWLTLGLLAGVTRAIPIIGPIIGGIPIVILALITKGVPVALAVLAFFTFLHFAESKFLMPMIIGDRMELHPVVVIVALLVGQEFGGLLGMFFAPPLAAIARVMVRKYWLRRHHWKRTHSESLQPEG